MSQIWGSFSYPISSSDECDRLFDEFSYRLERNEAHPLLQGHRLDIRAESAFSFLPTDSYPVSTPSRTVIFHAPVANRPRHSAFDKSTPRDLIVTLSEPIHTGRGYRAQVWKARAFDDIPVVVKIFQACYGEPPEWNPYEEIVEDFITEEEMAHREAWAYSELAHLQGSRIPHSYGFFDIKVPSGDIVCAHILEFVPGGDLDKLLEKLPRDGHAKLTRTLLATHLVETVIEFRRHNLTHDDLDGRNIICPKGSVDKTVIIDFGSAQNLHDCPDGPSDDVQIWYLLVTILGWRGAQTWMESKAEQCLTDPSWRDVLLEIRGTAEWEPYTEREWMLADRDDKRKEEARRAS